MPTFQTLNTCVAAYHLDSGGVSGTTLQDKTAFGHDLDLHTGSIAYATRDGEECMDFDNSWWFEGDAPEVAELSMVFVGAVDGSGGDGRVTPVNFAVFQGQNDNYDGVPHGLSNADWFGTSGQNLAVSFLGQEPQMRYRPSGAAKGGNFTAGKMGIATMAAPFDVAPTIYCQTNDGTKSSASIGTGARGAPFLGGVMRIGHLLETGGLTAGKYLSGKRLYIFEGDVFSHADFAAALAAEKTAWGIT